MISVRVRILSNPRVSNDSAKRGICLKGRQEWMQEYKSSSNRDMASRIWRGNKSTIQLCLLEGMTTDSSVQ